ncbi:MAG: amino acid adenylation domain-containing protein, partial [Candidatus Eremiobacteraeota bacterium]|nr:amino acid adenylation domain-containing protein [Candidatus Eremiobacteraeota bacterium]
AGVQGLFDIRADMATYGKVIGGGLPIGVLAGNARFMDALDGGAWQFGDASFPGVAPTFVAGTFVRHPLTMAAVCAVLRTIEEHGVALQQSVTDATSSLVTRLNDTLASRGIERRIESFGSFFFLDMSPADRLGNLLHYHLRLRGVYVQEGFPCFLTVAHTPADLGRIVAAFEESLDALQSAGILTVREQHLRLTEQQTEIWLAAQLSDEASCAFNESVSLRLRGTLDRATFARAWDLLVARHEALRASFDATGETMRIAPRVTFTLATTDASATMDPQAAVDAAIAAEARTPFDLARGPLVRGHLLQAGADDHVFVLTAHHIVCDGWSMNVLLREFAAAYGALVGGAMPTLPPPRPFRDYARHESLRTDEERARIESYWQAQFADLPVPLALPTDRPRTELRSFSGGTRTIRIDEATQRAIVAAGAGHGCTLFVTLLAAFTALVGRLADQRDIVVGVPVAGQAELDDAPMVGHCVHMLPIRSRWNDEARLHDLLAITKRAVLGAHDHQGTTLGALVQRIAPQREVGRLPLAEVQFNLERLADSLQLPALHGSVTPNPKAAVAFDLFFNVVEGADGLRIDCDYNAALFDQTTIERWLCCYRGMLDAIVRDADVPVAKAKFLPENEREVLVALQASPVPYPREATVHGLIEARVDEQPDAVAASCGDQGLTYRELDRRANRLAHHLKRVVLKQTGIVAICVDRSLDMLVALLATLKAGFAYLPLDPTHPVARLGFMLEDAGADALVVRDRRLTSQIPYAGTIVALSDDAATIQAAPALRPSHQTCARDRAYVIYTSGSTGKPKGVEVAHQSLVNLLCAMAREPGVTRDDALLAVTTIAFDIAALELFLPLVAGARVAIATSDDALDGFRLAQTLERTGATMLQATPSTWRLLLEADFRPAADFVMLCGGEPLDRALADALLARGGTLWNMYGPTETTIWSSCGRVAATGPITVGRPIANTQFFVLDSADELVPIGTPGHLHIGGDGVAIAYLGRTELTRERFIDNPFGAGRLYRTGDVAVVLPSGEIQLIGRTDRQVKLRGFRIELGEIEELLRQQPGLREAAVELRGAAEGARLVAYYAEREPEAVTVAELERALGSGLPAYMVPTAWVRVAALPRSPNGKLDRGALPQPEETSSGAPGYRPPENRLEEALAQICAEVLQRERVGTMDDLFALGADSIQLFKITARANRQGIGLHAKQLFAHRTIAELATHLS